jgi:hypothetical protein
VFGQQSARRHTSERAGEALNGSKQPADGRTVLIDRAAALRAQGGAGTGQPEPGQLESVLNGWEMHPTSTKSSGFGVAHANRAASFHTETFAGHIGDLSPDLLDLALVVHMGEHSYQAGGLSATGFKKKGRVRSGLRLIHVIDVLDACYFPRSPTPPDLGAATKMKSTEIV